MFSYLTNAEPEYINNLYLQYLKNPDAVERSWRIFFDGMSFGSEGGHEELFGNGSGNGLIKAPTNEMIERGEVPDAIYEALKKQYQVHRLIEAYRNRGHLKAQTDPLKAGSFQPIPSAKIDSEEFGLTKDDLETVFTIATQVGLSKPSTLQEIINHLEKVYCGSIGMEYKYIEDPEVELWFSEQFEKDTHQISIEQKKRILDYLNQASVFESFLSTKYAGQK